MGSITDMGLYVWDGATDPYNYQQLAQNFEILTFHDHTPGRGEQIPSGALAPGSVGSVNFDTTAQSFISAASHLKYTPVLSLPFTASDGQFVVASTPGVYGLPDASTVNQTITFVNNIPAGGLVTITPAGADQIFTEGGWGIPTLQLGALGSTITLQSDGGPNWIARTTPGRLRFVNAAVNTTAAHGQLINAVPGVTVTLPAPSVNAMVAVTANGAVTGANPVTVSGTNIYGLGLSAASSFKLGAAVAPVILQSDGTNWVMVSGQRDTGWLPLTLGTNITTVAGRFPPSVRVCGDMVKLSGTMVNATGAVIVGGTTVATVPAVAVPSNTVLFAPGLPGINFTMTVSISSGSGAVNVNGGSGAGTGWDNGIFLGLDGVDYRLA